MTRRFIVLAAIGAFALGGVEACKDDDPGATNTRSSGSPDSSTQASTASTSLPDLGIAECHASYAGECVPANADDADCVGGSGNGPDYVGRVSVIGPDVYDLDPDGNGVGCD